MRKLTKKERFQEKVLSKFHIYNSIFSTLPYENIADIGQLLPLFNDVCNNGYKKNKDLTNFQKKLITKYFFNPKSNIIYDNILSDEGGRFYHSQIRYMVCKLIVVICKEILKYVPSFPENCNFSRNWRR